MKLGSGLFQMYPIFHKLQIMLTNKVWMQPETSLISTGFKILALFLEKGTLFAFLLVFYRIVLFTTYLQD